MTTKFYVVLIFLYCFVKSGMCDFCGKIFTEKHFILKSENYPTGPYPEYKNCYYLIKGEKCTEFFEFEFINFDIKKTTGCTDERLEIGNQDAICGSKNGTKIYKAENGELKLKLVTTKVEERDIFNNGFKIYIKRVECPTNSIGAEDTNKFNTEEFTNEVPYEWTTSVVPTTIPTPTYFNTNLHQCCNQNTFNINKFVIVSPNFPFSVNTPEECSYVITKATPDICRIKLHFKFFYLGQPTYNSCPYGHLEIDGKFICGCNSNINLISHFGYSNTKLLNFKTFGIPLRNSYSGFIVEIEQDECPKKYRPDNSYLPPVQVKTFRTYEDAEHRVRWPNAEAPKTISIRSKRSAAKYFMDIIEKNIDRSKADINNKDKVRSKRNSSAQFMQLNGRPNIDNRPAGTEIEKAKLLSERRYVETPAANEISNDFTNVVKYVYYFAPEGENQGVDIDLDQGTNQEDRGTTDYINTSKINTILTNLYQYQECCQWNQIQFAILQSEFGNLGGLCRAPKKEKTEDCVMLESVSGNIRSPNYPFGYPAELNLCYRFHILPGYCEIKLLFNDFHLETSQDCRKDYLKLSGSGYRYCGSYLTKTTSILSAAENSAPELRFVSDFNNNGRGFSIYYHQILCSRYYNTGNTLENPTPSLSSRNYPSVFNSSVQDPNRNNVGVWKPLGKSPMECNKIVQGETFAWRDEKLRGSNCELRIKKANKDVCRLKLIFDEFNLKCQVELIMIEDREFCGNLTGQEVVINFDTPEKVIKYKNRQTKLSDDLLDNGKFRILGRQVDEDCGLTIPVLADLPEIQRVIDTIENPFQTNAKNMT